MRKFVKRFLTIVIGVIIGLVLAEFGLRIFYRSQDVKINTDHLKARNQWRDIPHAVQKPPGTLRIAFFGDSITYGQGVDLKDTFAAKTGEILRQKTGRPDIEILNFGVPAYNALDNLKNLKANVLKYDPDILVYGYCINDFDNPFNNSALIGKLKAETAKFMIFRGLEKYSRLARFLDWAIYQRFSRVRQLHDDWMNSTLSPQHNPVYEELRAALLETIQIVAQKNGLVMILPIFNSSQEDQQPYYIESRRMVAVHCLEFKCDYLDVFPHLKSKAVAHLWVKIDEHHPNPETHALIAQLVAEKLLPKIQASPRKPAQDQAQRKGP